VRDVVASVGERGVEGGLHRRHAAVKPRPRDRVNDRRRPFELGELRLSLLTHVFANVKPRACERVATFLTYIQRSSWRC
jgi:hypothetical protein